MRYLILIYLVTITIHNKSSAASANDSFKIHKDCLNLVASVVDRSNLKFRDQKEINKNLIQDSSIEMLSIDQFNKIHKCENFAEAGKTEPLICKYVKSRVPNEPNDYIAYSSLEDKNIGLMSGKVQKGIFEPNWVSHKKSQDGWGDNFRLNSNCEIESIELEEKIQVLKSICKDAIKIWPQIKSRISSDPSKQEFDSKLACEKNGFKFNSKKASGESCWCGHVSASKFMESHKGDNFAASHREILCNDVSGSERESAQLIVSTFKDQMTYVDGKLGMRFVFGKFKQGCEKYGLRFPESVAPEIDMDQPR